MVQGDFNAMLRSSKKLGGNDLDLYDLIEFEQCIWSTNLTEITSQGALFTCTNNQDVDVQIWCKLDRGFINAIGWGQFSGVYCLVLERGMSDHSPIIIHLRDFQRGRKKVFCFFNMWQTHPSFQQLISSAWCTEVQGTRMFQLWSKLKFVRKSLQKLNRREFSDL
ncbi:uncharacterized protein [Rutidosis leptorrhynchoides]|uniref:uncharacterized protein n=1 Tax=Rutidosis leptorrhynchoides TaxID=125765 RepID=UPI003A9A2775